MPGFFHDLGRKFGPMLRKGKWLYESVTGGEGDIIAAETGVGRDLAAAMLRELGAEHDPAVRQRIAGIGSRLAGCVADRRRSFVFEIVTEGEPNAFALPGGYVFITRSLVDRVGPIDDGIAWILGHEMGHVIRMDPMRRIMTDTVANEAVRRLPIPGGALARKAGGWAKSRGVELLQSAYSQERELMADKLGLALAIAAGYDGRFARHMLAKLQESRYAEPGLPLAAYFSTHPPFATRITEIEGYLKRKGLLK